jgi:hypothetical protein
MFKVELTLYFVMSVSVGETGFWVEAAGFSDSVIFTRLDWMSCRC